MQFTHWSRGVGRQEAPFQRSLSCVTRWDSDARGSTAGGQNRGGAYLVGALAIASAAAAAVATTCAIESEVPSAESAESPRAESCPVPTACGIDAIDHETKPVLANWSRTVTYTPSRLYLPESVGEIESLVRYAHVNNRKLRPVGTFLSPNGIAAGDDTTDLVSLSGVDRILHIDVDNLEVTVEAGITVDTLLNKLSKVGLTLANFSSIKEQQMGGWTQVAAHGTGATLSTVDDMITRMKLITPAKGTIELSETQQPELFRLARVGLGSLGIVAEMTLKCTKKHKLHERTDVLHGMEAVRARHAELLQQYRHVRYMWIPGTDTCVRVVSNPTELPEDPGCTARDFQLQAMQPFFELLEELRGAEATRQAAHQSFADVRDTLLSIDPLDSEHVARVNEAESQYWERAAGERVAWSDAVLGFDCGGSQWGFEVCLPAGTLSHPSGADLDFVKELKRQLEIARLPAPAPIEQRWTAASSSPMSPAYSENADSIFSWVGGIMYMPDDESRTDVTARFRDYTRIMNKLSEKFGAHAHWAKIELPRTNRADSMLQVTRLRRRLRERFDIKSFNDARAHLDPRGVLSNRVVDILFD